MNSKDRQAFPDFVRTFAVVFGLIVSIQTPQQVSLHWSRGYVTDDEPDVGVVSARK